MAILLLHDIFTLILYNIIICVCIVSIRIRIIAVCSYLTVNMVGVALPPLNGLTTFIFLPTALERSIQLHAAAFDFELFRHLSYMDISSSWESPFVVAVHTCETSATYCVLMRIETVAFPRT